MYTKQKNTKIYFFNYSLFLTAPNSILATDKEIQEAIKLHKNAELKLNKLSYLKELEIKNPTKYKILFEQTTKLIKEYKKKWLFATHTYSRRKINTKPVQLGLKSEFRYQQIHPEQYPLNKRPPTRFNGL